MMDDRDLEPDEPQPEEAVDEAREDGGPPGRVGLAADREPPREELHDAGREREALRGLGAEDPEPAQREHDARREGRLDQRPLRPAERKAAPDPEMPAH